MDKAYSNSDRAISDLHHPAAQLRLFHILRRIFGFIWVFNVFYQLQPAYIHRLFLKSLAPHPEQSYWYSAYAEWVVQLVQSIGASIVAVTTVIIGALLALSMLTGLSVRFFAWAGAVYTFLMWTTVGHMGGPYTQGATDPGTLVIYTLVFIIILLVEPSPEQPADIADLRIRQARPFQVARLLFGALWAFDAAWKWTAAFLHHPDSYLLASQAGQPAGKVAYIQFFIDVIRAVGPTLFGIVAAVAETTIAVSLLFNRGMRYILPFGLIYSLGLQTTAEGFEGPYGNTTGVAGDVLGTAIIYCLIFLYLMVMYPPKLRSDEKSRSLQCDGGF